MKTQLTHIGTILNQALEDFRPSADTGMTAIWELWNSVAGEALAQNAKPGAFNNGILIVHVSSSVWMHQLKFLKTSLMSNLNHALGTPLVKEMKFKIAALHN